MSLKVAEELYMKTLSVLETDERKAEEAVEAKKKEEVKLQDLVSKASTHEKLIGAVWQLESARSGWQQGKGFKNPEGPLKTTGALAAVQKSASFNVNWADALANKTALRVEPVPESKGKGKGAQGKSASSRAGHAAKGGGYLGYYRGA